MPPPPPPSPSPSPSAASSGGPWRARLSLYVLLALLLLAALWAFAAEYALVASAWGAPRSHDALLATADAVDDDDTAVSGADYYPEDIFRTDWSQRIAARDILHVNALHRACVTHRASVISWEFAAPADEEDEDAASRRPEPAPESTLINQSDPALLERIRQCPDVDIFLPEGLRSYGYCEDAVAYAKFLRSRMLPEWVLKLEFHDEARNRTVTYHDLCPNTPMLFFNHYWDGIPDSPTWPATKPLYLMPNIEMYELEASHYWRADLILCKTALCARYLRKWFKQEGNPKNTPVVYTRHTTSNVALTVRHALGDDAIKPKNFSTIEFVHTAGTSIQKGTNFVLDCWLSRKDLPVLHLYMDENLYNSAFQRRYGAYVDRSRNVVVHKGKLGSLAFGKLIAESAFFMCSSLQEGYGHYINQARSALGFIVTTDAAPMNELITPDSGALIRSDTIAHKQQFLGGTSDAMYALRGVPGFVAKFNGKDVCAAVEKVVKETTPRERERRAQRALQQYYFDTVFFAQKMQEIRDAARVKSHGNFRREGAAPVSLRSVPAETTAAAAEKETTEEEEEEEEGDDNLETNRPRH